MQPTRSSEGMSDAVATVVLAGVLGLGSGVLLALIAPSDKFSWAQLALLPAWVLLGVFFQFVSAFGATRRIRSLTPEQVRVAPCPRTDQDASRPPM